jgi:hypothetical protein
MKDIFLILIIFVVLTGCSTRQEKNKQSVNSTVVKQDTLATDKQLVHVAIIRSDSLKVETPRYFNDPLRNLKDFTVEVNYPDFDKIINDLTNSKNVKETIKTNFCWGDCCDSYKILVDSSRRISLYLCKVDCYEYSFGNDQFLFVNDTLSMIRNYNCSVFDFRTDSTSNSFSMQEKLFIFDKYKVKIKERKKILRGDENYTLKDIDFKDTEGDRVTLLMEKTKEFRERMNFADSLKTEN